MLLHRLEQFKDSLAHPLLLPMLFCELCTAADLGVVRGQASTLFDISRRTQTKMVEEFVFSRYKLDERDSKEASFALNRIITNLAHNELAVS